MCKKLELIVFLFLILFWITPQNSLASVLINEFSPSTDPEWVELYNNGSAPENLSGYKLTDENDDPSRNLFLSGEILPNGYLVFTHNDRWLNNSGGDTIRLYNNATPAIIIDEYSYGNVNQSESVARIPDGGSWVVTGLVTQGSRNLLPTPTTSPSPSPTPELTPSTTPTSTPTKTPTPTPLKTNTPIPNSTKTSTPKPAETEVSTATDEPETLINNLVSEGNTPKATGQVKGTARVNSATSLLSISLIILGTSFLIFGGVNLYKKAKLEYNGLHEKT